MLGGMWYLFLPSANEALIHDLLPAENRETAMKRAIAKTGAACQRASFVAPLPGGLMFSDLVLQKYLLGIALTETSVLVAFLFRLALTGTPGTSPPPGGQRHAVPQRRPCSGGGNPRIQLSGISTRSVGRFRISWLYETQPRYHN
jgi:hypothetical protein